MKKDINYIGLNNQFEEVKRAFDTDKITDTEFVPIVKLFNVITKGDPSQEGRFVKTKVRDENGNSMVRWISKDQAISKKPPKPGLSTPTIDENYSNDVLVAYAKETPEIDLKQVVRESNEPLLVKIAKAELENRKKDGLANEYKSGTISKSEYVKEWLQVSKNHNRLIK